MKINRLFLIAFIAIIVVSCQSDAEKADKLRLDNQFDKALVLYQKGADAGDAYAMWRLSNAYRDGDGVEFDQKEALKWLTKAAEGGCVEAKCELARAYIFDWYDIGEDAKNGKEMMERLVKETDNATVLTSYARLLFYGSGTYEEDKDKALRILEKIKDRNNPNYLGFMADIYNIGGGEIDRDMQKSIEYYKLAFEKGNRDCAYSLGCIYMLGDGGVTADTIAAIEWFKKGVAANQNDCMYSLAQIYLSEDDNFSAYHNPTRGMELLKKAIAHGNGEACYWLGVLYFNGKYVDKDDLKFYEYSKKASELRNPNGLYNLAYCYMNGCGCEKNTIEGLETYRKAVKYGSGIAAYALYRHYFFSGMYYVSKDSVENDYAEAKKYLLESARLGYDIGCFELAQQYYNGYGLFELNYQLAFNYMKKAADAGNVDACSALSYFYSEGIGCQKDPNMAREYEDRTYAK